MGETAVCGFSPVVVSVCARYCSSVIKDKWTGLNFGTSVIAQCLVAQHVLVRPTNLNIPLANVHKNALGLGW